ncbi:hypothetical protein U9M48_018815 [Paspalum notatum var. saurae]|uniref:Reverse transcriptase zinc-binding domain-containing protein n=1 Tax=Paspalum notatum var. saurae TaxID=547442 RepID=A0AAQ3WQT3_PASNO
MEVDRRKNRKESSHKRNYRLTKMASSLSTQRPRKFGNPKSGYSEQVLVKFKLVSGDQLRFWEDIWLGNQALKFRYPNLFNIVRKKHATVPSCKLTHVNLEEGTHIFIWGLHKTGFFAVRFMYRALISNGINMSQEIWRLRIPLKIKIFLWFLNKEVLLIKDNLARRNWRGNRTCDLCKQSKSIQHPFFDYIYANFSEESFYSGGLTGYDWAQLQCTDDTKDDIVRTCRSLESSAMELFGSHGWPFMFRIGC